VTCIIVQGHAICIPDDCDKEVSDALSSNVVQEQARNVTAYTVPTRRGVAP
jgi:hypothetical protein